MKLIVKCQNCRESFALKKNYKTRPDLIQDMGEYFTLDCTHCLSKREYHANDVKAKETFSVNLIGTAVGLAILGITTMFMWNQGVITNAGMIIGGGIIVASNYTVFTSNVTAFNRYMVTRTKRE